MLYKIYIPIKYESTKKIKCTIHFNKDTYHWATSTPKEKGYSLTCTPVEIGDKWETSTAFSGFFKIIYPIERQSKKRLETAIENFKDEIETYLKWFTDEYGYQFDIAYIKTLLGRNTKKIFDIEFKGNNDWNNPIYKVVDKEIYFGSTDILVPNKELGLISESNINDYFKTNPQHLEYFGTSFDCEPNGGRTDNWEFNFIEDFKRE